MVNVYATLIEKGLKTIDEVPARLRIAVQQELERRRRNRG